MWQCPKCNRAFKKVNQPHFCGEAPQLIDEYIASQSSEKQQHLISLNNAIKAVLPNAKQHIKWSMPTYSDKGIIVQFAAHQHFISFYVGSDVIEHFQKELSSYPSEKGAIYFYFDQPLPINLIQKISKYCEELNHDL